MGSFARELKQIVRGDVYDDAPSLSRYSRDASLFEVTPKVIVSPLDSADISALVRYVFSKKKTNPGISITVRSAGTDMSGGPLGESIILDVSKNLNRFLNFSATGSGASARVMPGLMYRDFDRETKARGFILPSYPASREICSVGGMVNNNSGGEKTLRYGKTDRYVSSLRVVLSDGSECEVKPLTERELNEKMNGSTLESSIYRRMYDLLRMNAHVIASARPRVSKNSSGYALWNVWDGKTFDLTKLFVGAQGTLGIVTEATLSLVPKPEHTGMAVIFLRDLSALPEVTGTVLTFHPSSFESFDDHTFRLALKFWRGFVSLLAKNPVSLFLSFLPEFWMVVTRGFPKLVLIVEFEEGSSDIVNRKLDGLARELSSLELPFRIMRTPESGLKYWAIRRESFNLLRQRVKDRQTAPFVDDVVIRPESAPEFLPKLYAILDRYGFLYTIAGHVGDGNFHIIPLMKLSDPEERAKIFPAMDEVYSLVRSYGGSMTGEHNDGLIRSSFLPFMFGGEVCELFLDVKNIFDPEGIFNPGKKVRAERSFAEAHVKRS